MVSNGGYIENKTKKIGVSMVWLVCGLNKEVVFSEVLLCMYMYFLSALQMSSFYDMMGNAYMEKKEQKKWVQQQAL